ncbi:MAG: hypothetical protein IT564_12685, partial [Rhodospirillales bacterium]|nr:hypothetical protein [Rhodospirillales bacterium]
MCRYICALSGLLLGLVLSVSAGAETSASADVSASAGIGASTTAGADVSSETWILQPGTELVGEVGTVIARQEDTLTDIARMHGLGYEEIIWANPGTDIWLPGEGTVVTLPTRFILPSARS